MSDATRSCQVCEKPLAGKTRGRPQTKFCSRECNESFHSAEKSRKIAAAKTGRTCVQCDGPIPVAASARTKTCSRACGVTHQNQRRQLAKRAAWEATKPPCNKCGSEIPAHRPRGSKFCSVLCKRRATSDRYRERNPLYQRLYRYGLTAEQYEALVDAQGDRCAICRTGDPGGKGGWHVDHCHETGVVRGLLCHHCNIAIGYFKDDPLLIRLGIEYLGRANQQAA
ncbi:endonuclease VII domain-containing protein [Actinoplanes sp. CA-051413]|uniref:endonuclease VII domain-containing protein n=1 Tax=Actinoplanes sp. CA-051413 TaxID=3239899 RepID=UPI003D9641FE